MKTIFILFALLLSAATLTAQTVYTRTDTIPVTLDSVTFQAGEFRGIIQWQHSGNKKNWEDLAGKIQAELKVVKTATGYYRAEITDGTCFPAYSDTARLVAAIDTTTPEPPAVPSLPEATLFAYTVTDAATDNAETQMEFGTTGKDRIAQYAGTATTTQYADGSEDDDWILQVGGDATTTQQIVAGDGDDTCYQYAGTVACTMTITGGEGSKTFIQVGGDSNDNMSSIGGHGTASVTMYGMDGADIIVLTGSVGGDTLEMYGGAGDDAMTYTSTSGADDVTINGGDDDDTLTINLTNGTNMTLEDAGGNILYSSGSGGTTITAINTEKITVKDAGGNVVFQR